MIKKQKGDAISLVVLRNMRTFARRLQLMAA
jgi:hypothetical protein